jgi:hypothetical protein
MHDACVRHTHLVHCGRFDEISDSLDWLGVQVALCAMAKLRCDDEGDARRAARNGRIAMSMSRRVRYVKRLGHDSDARRSGAGLRARRYTLVEMELGVEWRGKVVYTKRTAGINTIRSLTSTVSLHGSLWPPRWRFFVTSVEQAHTCAHQV